MRDIRQGSWLDTKEVDIDIFEAKIIILEEFMELMRVQKPWGNWGK